MTAEKSSGPPGFASGVDLDECIELLFSFCMPSAATVQELCDQIKKNYYSLPNVVSLRSPVTVVGDIHGHFFELVEVFRVGGYCPDTNYLFLGNYVDMGHYSIQSLMLLFCLKLRHPDRITLLRGNHETKAVSQAYGLYGECMHHYGSAAPWRHITEAFQYLPIAAVIDDTRLCIHSGLSPTGEIVDQLRVLDRFVEPEPKSTLADILWSSPSETYTGFHKDPKSGVLTFGAEVLNRFLHTNNLQQVIRGHSLCTAGFREFWSGKLLSLWSAPNFCDRVGNAAAIAEFDGDTISVVPYLQPPLRERLSLDVHATESLTYSILTCETTKDLPDYLR